MIGDSVLTVFMLFGILALFLSWRLRSQYRRSGESNTRDHIHFSVSTPSTFGQTLTRREMQIALLVADGKRNSDVARELSISVHTVESHLKHIYRKLDVCSRVELARSIRDVAH